MKPDRMTAYEAPREPMPLRQTVGVELLWRGAKGHGKGKGTNKQNVVVPRMKPMSDIILCQGHYFVHRSDDFYVEGSMWPILDELD